MINEWILKSQTFQDFEIFSKCFVHDNFTTSGQFFTKMHDDSKETFDMKFVDLDKFYNFVLEGLCQKNT